MDMEGALISHGGGIWPVDIWRTEDMYSFSNLLYTVPPLEPPTQEPFFFFKFLPRASSIVARASCLVPRASPKLPLPLLHPPAASYPSSAFPRHDTKRQDNRLRPGLALVPNQPTHYLPAGS